MSLDSAAKFLKKYNEDPAFRSTLETAKDLDERRQLINAAGFDFTQDELNHVAKQPTELSNGDLEDVAGGVENPKPPPPNMPTPASFV